MARRAPRRPTRLGERRHEPSRVLRSQLLELVVETRRIAERYRITTLPLLAVTLRRSRTSGGFARPARVARG